MTTSFSSRPDSATLDKFADQLNAVRENVMANVGEAESKHIRKIIRIQRVNEIVGRICIPLGFYNPILWIVGVLLLSVSKILDNMEIGHNVMHGQYDWMNDKHINSRSFDWDNAGDSNSWKRYHNHEHHTYTNVIGKDRDFGYGLLRLSDDTRWKPKNVWQFFTYMALAVFFEFGIAYHEVAGERVFMGKRKKKSSLPISIQKLRSDFFGKIGRQFFKDYIFYPLICFPAFLYVLSGNLAANLIRNLWTNTIIFCGHFTEDIHTFKASDCKDETQGQWYYRQVLGSSNLEGRKWFHILTGHLSCQVEHHLFPDVPAQHYPAMAKEVEKICSQYGVPYNTGPFAKQLFTVWQRIIKYSFPTAKQASTVSV
ncbi:MAG: fatty acid desaturase [Bermanella sp.]|jgi:fatty acid desaturase